jgi:formate hydrogenlyase transcriptional activator
MACRKPGAFAPLGQRFPPHMARFLSPLVDRIRQKLLPDHRSERLSRECSHQRIVLDVNNHLARHLEPRALFQAISEHLRAHFSYDSLNLLLLDEASGEASIRFVDFPTGRGFMQENQRITHGDGPAMRAIRERRPLLSERKDLIQSDPGLVQALVEGEGLQTTCCIPLISRNRALGSLNFGSRDERAFSQQDVDLLCAVANQVAIALDNAFAYEQIQQLKDRLTEEKLYLEEEVREEFAFGEVIGHSPSLQKVLRQIQTVATSDATVLLLGETGTGKELMARALHTLSSRKDHTFVKLNCAAIPLGLVESELFGHERGAFTGAIAQKTGRMELAHQGTLFLDEVGEMPLDLQTKLLRAIQEREFERLGGTRTHKVDVRLIAATNRDLAAMVQEGTFRSDLYYRLKVFPIQMPPLRERKDDIPLLVSYFTQKYAQRMKRHIESIPARAMDAMVAWPWPGNVRELENFLERCVILTRGQELYVPISELRQPDGSSTEESPLASLQDAEREHILRALRESNGKVGGADGAAARLGMKRTTLQSRMLKLGIPTPAMKPTFRQ